MTDRPTESTAEPVAKLSDADAEVVARIVYLIEQRASREDADRRIADRSAS